MAAKVLPFLRPAHECFYPKRLMSAGVFTARTCPLCKEHQEKKRDFVTASRRRGRHNRMFFP